MSQGFMYLAAVVDWYSRYVLSWRLTNTLDGAFCNEALDAALELGTPDIFNTDQGCQYTSPKFTQRLLDRNISISMDGRGRALDNIFIERIWRSLKYEDIYLKDYQSGQDLFAGMSRYFPFYNNERIHQSLNYLTPAAVYASRD
jgi:putative transposase